MHILCLLSRSRYLSKLRITLWWGDPEDVDLLSSSDVPTHVLEIMTRIAFGQSLLDHGWCWCWWELSGDLTGTNPQPICSRRRPAAAQSHPPASSSLWWARAGSGLAPPQPCQQPPSAQLSPAPHTTNLILIARHVATVGSCSEWRSQFQHGGKEKRLYARVNIIGTYSHVRTGPARDFIFIF